MSDLPKLKNDEVFYSTTEKEIKRLTSSLLIKQVLAFFNFEKGYLNSIYILVKNPGNHIRAYLSIQREKLINPFKFYFIGASIYAFVFLKIYTINRDLIESASLDDSDFKAVFIDYIHIWYLLLVVFITIFSFWFFKKKSGYNFAENLIFNMYVMGVILLASAILSPLEFIFEYYQIIVNLILLFYFIYSYISFFKVNYLKAIVLSIACIILGVVTMALTIISVGVIYGFIEAI